MPAVTFLEVLPKDKKAKEEKTSILGQTSIDLLPLIIGPSSGPINSITAFLQSSSPESSRPPTDNLHGIDVVKVSVDLLFLSVLLLFSFLSSQRWI